MAQHKRQGLDFISGEITIIPEYMVFGGAACSLHERFPEAHSELTQASALELFAKIMNGFPFLTIFAKKLHLRCLTRFKINPVVSILI